MSDRGLGSDADLYLALSHLKQSNFKEAAYYCDRLQEEKGAADNELFNRIQAAVKTQEARDRREQRSYALNQLDLKLLPYLGEQPGIFIEAGGNDGISQSNTLYFERHHQWRGILVEGIPDLAEKCLANRPRAWVENCDLVPFDFPIDPNDLLQFDVRCRRCDEHRRRRGEAYCDRGTSSAT